MGNITRTSVSLLNIKAPPAITKQINTVHAILKAASSYVFFLL